MSQLIMHYTSNVLLNFMQLVVLVALSYGIQLIKKGHDLIDSKTTATNRIFLESVAKDAVLFVEQQWKGLDGSGKFSQAVQHAVQVLNDHGVSITTQDVQAAIQGAYATAKANGLFEVGNTKDPSSPLGTPA